MQHARGDLRVGAVAQLAEVLGTAQGAFHPVEGIAEAGLLQFGQYPGISRGIAAQHDLHGLAQALVLGQLDERVDHHRAQVMHRRVALVGGGALQLLHEGQVHPLDDRGQHLALVLEVPVHRAAGIAGAGADHLQRGAGDAMLVEAGFGGVQDAFPGRLGVLFGLAGHEWVRVSVKRG
ncbi:hypothetical protein D3C71_1111400 [compost metagenome]